MDYTCRRRSDHPAHEVTWMSRALLTGGMGDISMTRATVARQLAALALVCASSVVRADYPLPKDNYVNDYAKRLSDSTEQHIRDELAALERDTGVEVTVAVIGSVAEYGTGHATIELFATGLFNAWGVGNRDRNDGILLLVAVSDRALRIELGSGYSRGADDVALDIIDREILPHFKNETYAKGIRAGTAALTAKVRAGALPLNTGLSALMSNTASAVQRFENWPEAGAGGMALILVYSAWRYFARRRPRQCPKCRATMRRLDEVEDNRHLNAGEQLEERLASVDYDVWLCPACKTTEKIQNKAWFSSYSTCPKCRLRTLKETTQVLQEATYTFEGSRRISADCRSCRHHSERTESIPRKEESRSSSSSSFGGGKSSGGGATGRW